MPTVSRSPPPVRVFTYSDHRPKHVGRLASLSPYVLRGLGIRRITQPGVRMVITELPGTCALVFFAVGSAVFGFDDIGPVGVALAFGLTLLALAYAIGPISG